MAKKALTVSGIVFLIVSLLHLARVLFKFNLVIGETVIPVWVNLIGFVAAGGLSFWVFKARRTG